MNGITVNEILIAIALLSTAFSVFLFFRKPQEALDKEQALTNKEVDTKATLLAQKEAEGKAAVLAAQFQYEREATSQRFKDVQDAVKDATLLAANHIHTIDTKVDGLLDVVATLSNNVTKLSTIIDERIPKK